MAHHLSQSFDTIDLLQYFNFQQRKMLDEGKLLLLELAPVDPVDH